jgi:hypothetical protein
VSECPRAGLPQIARRMRSICSRRGQLPPSKSANPTMPLSKSGGLGAWLPDRNDGRPNRAASREGASRDCATTSATGGTKIKSVPTPFIGAGQGTSFPEAWDNVVDQRLKPPNQ